MSHFCWRTTLVPVLMGLLTARTPSGGKREAELDMLGSCDKKTSAHLSQMGLPQCSHCHGAPVALELAHLWASRYIFLQ